MYRIFNLHFELEKAFLNLSQINVEKKKKRKKKKKGREMLCKDRDFDSHRRLWSCIFCNCSRLGLGFFTRKKSLSSILFTSYSSVNAN